MSKRNLIDVDSAENLMCLVLMKHFSIDEIAQFSGDFVHLRDNMDESKLNSYGIYVQESILEEENET